MDNEVLEKRIQSKVGVVEAKSGAKTVRVRVTTRKPHPLYKKVINKSKKFLVHDPKEEASIGDKVRILLSRPISARKKWRLDAIITN